jgi:hypothetical protein
VTSVAIHQPHYLPWLPYLDKADSCDIFVYLDNVQFQKGGFQNRNTIKNSVGPMWLTVPTTARLGTRIDEVTIAGTDWKKRHTRSIRQAYSRAPYLSFFEKALCSILEKEWDLLSDLDIETCEWMFGVLQIESRRVRASQLGVKGHKSDLVINICKALGADMYVSGPGAKVYQDPQDFAENDIELLYHVYSAKPYPQCHQKLGFVKDLSALDLILNLGPASREVMLDGRLARIKADQIILKS